MNLLLVGLPMPPFLARTGPRRSAAGGVEGPAAARGAGRGGASSAGHGVAPRQCRRRAAPVRVPRGVRPAPRPPRAHCSAPPIRGLSPRPPIASGGRAVRSAPLRVDITARPGGAGPGGRARPPPRAARVVVKRRLRIPHRCRCAGGRPHGGHPPPAASPGRHGGALQE